MRILIVDDEPAMHDSYRRCLAPTRADDAVQARAGEPFDLVHHRRGVDAAAEIERARAEGRPFAVAIIGACMPPGIDGRETARRIRSVDTQVNLCFVTDCPDFDPLEIARVAGPVDKILYIAQPFEVAEVRQAATALAHRWRSDRESAGVRERLADRVAKLEEHGLELAANESRAIHAATHDSLTDAPNRLFFVRALTDRARRPGLFATAMVDLDRFKLVNDTLGHLAGDALIREVCAILERVAPDGALVARLGGDEFGVLFDTPDQAAAVMACDRMVAACDTGHVIYGNSVQGGASCGVAAIDGPVHDPIEVLRRADLALNDAKRAGRGVVRVFDDGMDEGVRFRERIESGLREAIERGELSLAYQPIVERGRLGIVGFEALLRWETVEHGPISPAIFIPIAEESNLIHEIGDWVLERALAEVVAWPGRYVSVNFSPRQFRRHDFIAHVVERVARAGVEPAQLQIEITETAIFDDPDRAADTLHRLRRLGFRIALDDFGAGYSSLCNIRKFALDCLKIDRSFIEGMGRERESAAIVHSIIHLGRALGLDVVAEGVETEVQIQALRMAGASHLQGFYLSRPVSAEVAAEMVAAGSIGAEPVERRMAISAYG